jgi:hypothetical protein
MKLEDVVPIDDLTEHQFQMYMEARGGCTCFISPPCHACIEPPTREELEDVGFELEDE